MAVVFPRVAFEGAGEDIDHKFDGGVADGVDAHLPAGVVDFIEMGGEFVLGHL